MGPAVKLAIRQAILDEDQRLHTQSIVRSSNVLTSLRALHAAFPSHPLLWAAVEHQAAKLGGARRSALYLRSGTLDGLTTRRAATRWAAVESVLASDLELAGPAWQLGAPQKRGLGSRCALRGSL